MSGQADFDFQPTLTGALITMRPYADSDFDALYAVASDPLIWEVHPVPERAERRYFKANTDDALSDNGGLVAIEGATGAIIGFSRYSKLYVGADEMEIGWTFLARRLWGGQYNQNMKRIMLAHALASFPRVIFRVGEENWRSRGAMTKIGGALIPWEETITALGRDMRYVAIEITRESFAVGPLADIGDCAPPMEG
jgi:RimJ/RimL family protein N-acetyltransferase